MTQTARPQTPWLVPPGDMTSFGRSSFTVACRGHEKMGEVLSYFVYEASWQAKNEGRDVQSEDCTFITIEREQKHMLGRIKVCQKSLIAYINQLEAWGFLVADGYRHTYQVHFRKITEAIANPPETIKKKPRGKHAPAPSLESQSEARLSKIQSQRAKLQSRMVKIQSEFVKLQSRMVKIQFEMVKIQSSETAESASEQGLEGAFGLPRISRSIKNIVEDSLVVSASAESDEVSSFLSSLSSFEETLQEVQNGKAPRDVSSCAEEGHIHKEPLKAADTSNESAHASAEHDTTQEALQESPTQVALVPAVRDAPTKPISPEKTHGKSDLQILEAREARNLAIRQNKRKKLLKEACLSPAEQATYTKWEAHYNARCGGEPEEDSQFYAATNDLIKLVKRFSDWQLQALDDYFTKEHFKWKQPAWQHALGAVQVWKEHQPAIAYLKEQGKWPLRETPAGVITSTRTGAPGDKYVLEIRRRAAEAAARNASAQGVAL